MSENVKNGLLIFVAALLVVNTVLLVKNGNSSYADPTDGRAAFTRDANDVSSAAVLTNKEASMDQLTASAMQSTAKVPEAITQVKFDESSHDFGSVMQDSENKKIFRFTNTGSEPLIIEKAKGSCGCTVPTYPKEPIPPGGTGEIEVVYRPGKQKNKQTKTVTIEANTEPATTILTITADVKEA